MKKKFTFMMAALMLLTMMVLPGKAVGQTRADAKVTITISSFTDLPSGSASYATYSWTQDGISGKATIFANTSSTSMQFNASNYLFYSTSEISGVIKSIKLTTASGTNRTYVVYGSTSAYSGSGTSYGTQIGSQTVTTSGTTYTVSSGEYTYFTIVKTGSGAGYLSSVEVTYTPSGGGGGSSVATPEFSKGTSYCDEAQSITISCATDGATIHYTLDGSEPTSESTTYSEAISITETTTLKAIAIKDEESSEVASATYTFVNTLKTLEAIFNAATTTSTQVYIHFNNWVITGNNGGTTPTTAYLTDGINGCLIYESGHGFVAGNVLNGIVSCNLSQQSGMARLTGLKTSTTGLVVTTGGIVTPVETTITALSAINTGSVVTIKGLTFDGTLFSDGENQITKGNIIYNASLVNGNTYDITGVIDFGYGTTPMRINPRNADDVVPGPATLPFIWAGGGKADLQALQGVTTSTLSSDYANSNSPYLVKFDADGKYIVIRTDQQIGSVTVGIKKIGGSSNSNIIIQGSANGTDYTNIQTFTNAGAQNAELEHTTTNTFALTDRYVRIYFVKGNSGSNIGVGPISIAVPSAEPSIIVDATKDIAHNAASGSIEYEINNPDGGVLTAEITTITGDWLELGTVTSSAVPFTCSANTTNTPRSATVTLTYTYGDSQTTTATVEVTQSGAPRYYALAKSIIPGKSYIITNGSDKAMGQQNNNNRAAVGVSIINGIATVTNNDVYEFVVNTTLINDKVYYSFYDETNNGYLYPASGGNYLKTEITLSNSSKWDISFEDGGVATIVSQTELSTDKMRYNNSNNLFSCYSSGQSDIYLYMKVDTYLTADGNWNDGTKWIEGTIPTSSNDVAINAACTIPSSITARARNVIVAGNSSSLTVEDGGQLICSNSVAATVKRTTKEWNENDQTAKGWYAISSPVNNVAIADFAKGTHNVYSYDEPTHYWHEYNSSLGEIAAFDHLTNGRGYLYRSTEANIEFAGDVNIDNATYTLSYTDAAGNLAGFHLIGNPYTHNIYKGDNAAINSEYLTEGFYTLNVNGGWEAGTDNSTAIVPGRAVLVQAIEEAGAGQTLTITNTDHQGPQAKYANDQIMFTVENTEYSDNSYVLFKEGHGLNKIDHRNAEIPMLYVISEGENYAIADMPDNTDVINLGFEAKTMGQYTISLKAEGQYSYMHLVDKLTGNDIDMLVEDSYTFVGTPNDRNDRFVLRLNYNAAGIDTESDIFAYQSGNDIMVSGEGELQVFDITGRKVMTTDINGVETINGMNRGVYIFRLNEKTQKIVVR